MKNMAYFYFSIEYEQVKVKIKKQKVIILLKTPHKYAKTKCLGLSVSLTAREKRAILRVTSNSLMTVRQVAETAEFYVDVEHDNTKEQLQLSLELCFGISE
ncbi:hypothetical protein HZH66_013988 [Vespula vulgaris]|uniref:Uncharacterized protein n=1 Tax=Vespula vulgaris TaxID=7454 RepID=A0A834J4I2_VESVU|nr:hypothetical protein HZH66_013988 [Vespula vulgaris]